VQLDRYDRDHYYHHHHHYYRDGGNDNTMNEIAAGAIGFVLGSATN
jgi:hypothetical protein